METHNHSIASTAMVVMSLTGLGYVLGFLVQVIIAKYFGVGADLDAFVVAAVVPEFIFGLSNAVFLTSLMVLFAEYQKSKGIEAGKKYIHRMFTVVVLCASVVAIGIAIFSPWIAQIIAPGFSEQQLAATIILIQILSIAAVFFVLSSFTTAILYHEQKFTTAKLLRVIISASIIIAVIGLGQKIGINSLALGTVFGIAIAFVIQYIVVKKQGYSLSLLFWEKSDVKELLLFSFPLVITSLFFYANKVVMNIIASTTGAGSVTILNYGFLLVNVPVLFFSESLVTSLFPHFTKNAANNEIENIKDRIVKAVHVLLFILTPVMIIFMIFSHEIIYYLFERGAFTADATKAVSDVLLFFATGLIPLGLMAVLGSTLNAIKRVKERMYLFLSLLVINILLSLLLIPFFSYKGIAIATSTGYWIVVIGGMGYLLKTLKFDGYRKLFIEGLKLIVVSGISAVLVSLLHTELLGAGDVVKGSIIHIFLFFGLIIMFLLSYCLLMKAVKAESWAIVMQAFGKKNGR